MPGSTNPTSNLLQIAGRNIVVDCGLGVTRGLVDQGVQLRDISAIFITHIHSDHYLELGPLLHTAWTAGLRKPVVVYGPEGLGEYWMHFSASMRADIEVRIHDEGRLDLRALVAIRVIREGTVFDDGTVKVQAIKNIHPPLVNTFALSFEDKKGKVVFSGDTAYLPEMADFAKGADLLGHEAMLEEGLDALFDRIGNGDEKLRKHWYASHTMAHDAGRVATDAAVGALAPRHL